MEQIWKNGSHTLASIPMQMTPAQAAKTVWNKLSSNSWKKMPKAFCLHQVINSVREEVIKKLEKIDILELKRL